MKLKEFYKQDIEFDNKNIYLTVPFTDESVISYKKDESNEYFLYGKELDILKKSYKSLRVTLSEMCIYSIFYGKNKYYKTEDPLNVSAFNDLVKNSNYYNIFDKIYIDKNNNYYVSSNNIEFIKNSELKELLDAQSFNNLVKFYKNIGFQDLESKVKYYCDNLEYYPDDFINNLSINTLIENIYKFNSNDSIYNNENFHIKLLCENESKHELFSKKEDILLNSGYRNLENIGFIRSTLEDLKFILEEMDISYKSQGLLNMLFYYLENDCYPPEEWIDENVKDI